MPLAGHCTSSESSATAPSKWVSSVAWSANSEYLAFAGPPGVDGAAQSTVASAPVAGGRAVWHTSLPYPAGKSARSLESNDCGSSAAVVVRGVRLVVSVFRVVVAVLVGP